MIDSKYALFLDTKFKTKYICDTELSREERKLDVEEIVEIIKEKHIAAEEVYELQNTEEQICLLIFGLKFSVVISASTFVITGI